MLATEVGDYVERDEEIATIETDKVRRAPSILWSVITDGYAD